MERLSEIADAIAAHRHDVDGQALVLYAGTNALSPAAAAMPAPDLGTRPSMGRPELKENEGTEHLASLEVLSAAAVAETMGAEWAEVRMQSATLANLAVLSALTDPGDVIAGLPSWAGGHVSHHGAGAAGIRGLHALDLPYDGREHDIDHAGLQRFLQVERPRVVVVGGSLVLFPYRLIPLAAAVHAVEAKLVFDASHVAGLIAGKQFPNPLAQGADVVTFSTYKSFPGPAGGAILANDAKLAGRIERAVYPGLSANYDASRLGALGVTATELELFGVEYACRCIAGAQRLGARLAELGLTPLAWEHGYTATHHLAIPMRSETHAADATRALARASILVSATHAATPAGPVAALRLGTQELTRRGFSLTGFDDVATLMARVVVDEEPPEQVGEDAILLRESHPEIAFCLPWSSVA